MAENVSDPTQGCSTPEEIVTLVEVVVVEPHECILLIRGKGIIDRFLKYTYTRMVHIRLSRILEEKNVADKTIEAVAYPETILVCEQLGRL